MKSYLVVRKNNWLENCTKQLLDNLQNEKYTHILKTIFFGIDLANMQIISKHNKAFQLLMLVIDIYSKYT